MTFTILLVSYGIATLLIIQKLSSLFLLFFLVQTRLQPRQCILVCAEDAFPMYCRVVRGAKTWAHTEALPVLPCVFVLLGKRGPGREGDRAARGSE